MPKSSRSTSQLELVAQITPYVEIEDVRLLRLSARIYVNGESETAQKVRLRMNTGSDCRQAGTKLSATVRFGLSGVHEQDEKKRVVDLSAAFELSYSLSREVQLTPRQLRAFGKVNALYNAWPYWRELVQTTISRMGLPRLVVPVFRVIRPKLDGSKPAERAEINSLPQQSETGSLRENLSEPERGTLRQNKLYSRSPT